MAADALDWNYWARLQLRSPLKSMEIQLMQLSMLVDFLVEGEKRGHLLGPLNWQAYTLTICS